MSEEKRTYDLGREIVILKAKLEAIETGATEAIVQLEKEIALAPHKSISWYRLNSQLSTYKWALHLSTQRTNSEGKK